MPNYQTSTGRKINGKCHRFVVEYEYNFDSGLKMTFAVTACRFSEATALVIAYIDANNLHPKPETGIDDEGYTLIPRVSNEKADYTIN